MTLTLQPVDRDSLIGEVSAKIAAAPLHLDPFPHLVIEELLPRPAFDALAAFSRRASQLAGMRRRIKFELRHKNARTEFAEFPEAQDVMRMLYEDVMKAAVAPALVPRLVPQLHEKFAGLAGVERAGRIMDAGFAPTRGRLMFHRHGYKLNPHSDSAHFGITCLLYFTQAVGSASSTLCFYRPERIPDLHHLGTYYPERDEGIGVQLVKTIPTNENLFVAFLNTPLSVHGASYDDADPASVRVAFQAHLEPRDDPRRDAEALARDADDPAVRNRWQSFLDRERSNA